MSYRFDGAIGIQILFNHYSQTRSYKIIDEALFARFLEQEGHRVCDLPPIATVRYGPGIHFNEWTNVDFLNNGFTLFDSDARDNLYYTVSDERVSPLLGGICHAFVISGVICSICVESQLPLEYCLNSRKT